MTETTTAPAEAPAPPVLSPQQRFVARVQQAHPDYQLPGVAMPAPAAAPMHVVTVPSSNVVPQGTPAQRAEQERQILAASRQTGEPSIRPGVSTHLDRLTYAQVIQEHVDKDGFVDSHLLAANRVLSWGYQLPPNVKLHAATAYTMLETARRASIDQDAVTKWFNATAGKPK